MPYLLPDLGEGMTEAEIVQWRVAVGDHVTRDQIVAHVQTDKAEVELPVPASGTIVALGAEVGDLVPVGAPLLELVPDAGTALAAPRSAPRPGRRRSATAAAGRHRAGPARHAGPVQAAPPVRKLAKELGIDLATVAGTGPGGRVTAADVRADAPAADARAARAPARGTPGDGPQHGRGLARGPAHLPVRRDRRPSAARRSCRGARRARRRHHAHRVLRARRVLALDEYPILNASLDPDADEIVYHDACHVGVAVASDDGLVVPVVHDAQRRTLVDLGHEIARVTEAGRAGHLPPDEIRGATFTVTNFGTEGGRFATPIVRPPQVAILGFGVVRVARSSTGTRWSPRRRCRSRSPPTTGWSTATTPPGSSKPVAASPRRPGVHSSS